MLNLILLTAASLILIKIAHRMELDGIAKQKRECNRSRYLSKNSPSAKIFLLKYAYNTFSNLQ